MADLQTGNSYFLADTKGVVIFGLTLMMLAVHAIVQWKVCDQQT